MYCSTTCHSAQPLGCQNTRPLDKVRAVRELEQARAGLELSERRHRELVEAVPAFVLSLDAEGRIALWNDQLERVTGFRRAEMLGKPGRDLVADGDRRLPLKKGGHRMVRWKCAAVSGPDQQPVTYALGTDVTEERDMLTRTLRAELRLELLHAHECTLEQLLAIVVGALLV